MIRFLQIFDCSLQNFHKSQIIFFFLPLFFFHRIFQVHTPILVLVHKRHSDIFLYFQDKLDFSIFGFSYILFLFSVSFKSKKKNIQSYYFIYSFQLKYTYHVFPSFVLFLLIFLTQIFYTFPQISL